MQEEKRLDEEDGEEEDCDEKEEQEREGGHRDEEDERSAPADVLVSDAVLHAEHGKAGGTAVRLLLQKTVRGEWRGLARDGRLTHAPHLAVLCDQAAPSFIRAVPHQLLGPGLVRQDVAAVEGIDDSIGVHLSTGP